LKSNTTQSFNTVKALFVIELTFWLSVISFLQSSCHFHQKLKKGRTQECTVRTVAKSEGGKKRRERQQAHFSLVSNQKARKSSRDEKVGTYWGSFFILVISNARHRYNASSTVGIKFFLQ